jgi:hypothetical protein
MQTNGGPKWHCNRQRELGPSISHFSLLIYPEDGGSKLDWNINDLSNYTTLPEDVNVRNRLCENVQSDVVERRTHRIRRNFHQGSMLRRSYRTRRRRTAIRSCWRAGPQAGGKPPYRRSYRSRQNWRGDFAPTGAPIAPTLHAYRGT